MKYRRDFQQSNVFRVRRRVWRHCKILMKISNSFILVFLQSFSEYKKYRKRISLKYIYLLIALYNYKLLCCNNLLSICYLRKELLYLDELCLERGLCYHLGIFLMIAALHNLFTSLKTFCNSTDLYWSSFNQLTTVLQNNTNSQHTNENFGPFSKGYLTSQWNAQQTCDFIISSNINL